MSFFSKKQRLFLTSIFAYSFFIDSVQALPTTDALKISPVLSSKLSTLLGEGTFTGTVTVPLSSALNGSVGASLIASLNIVNGSLVGSPTSYAIVYNTLNPLNPVILGTLSAASNYFTGLALQPGKNFGAKCMGDSKGDMLSLIGRLFTQDYSGLILWKIQQV